MIAIVVRDLLLLWSFLGSTNAQCDTYFPDQQISYISSNPSSPSVYYLSNSLSSAASCKAACEDLNFMCDASQKHTFDHVEGSFSTDPDLCRLTLNDPGNDYGSAMILTPDIAAAEYTIEMNFRITSGEEGGLVFGASNSKFPNVYVVVSQVHNRMHIGKLHSGGAEYTVWQDVNTKTISHNVDYTIKIVKLSSGHWRAYLDNVLEFSSSSSAHKVTSSAFPQSRVGAYSWNANMRYNWLKVSFPSSARETVCSGYVFNSANSQCSGYYGADYAALYQSLSSNTGFDSGIMSPTCPPTTAPPTTPAPTTPAPTTKVPTASPTRTPTKPPSSTPTATPTTPSPTEPGEINCGDSVEGAYGGVAMTISVNMAFEGAMTFDARASSLAIPTSGLRRSTSPSVLDNGLGDEDVNAGVLTISNLDAGTYLYLLDFGADSGTFSIATQCRSDAPTKAPAVNPTRAPNLDPTMSPTPAPTENASGEVGEDDDDQGENGQLIAGPEAEEIGTLFGLGFSNTELMVVAATLFVGCVCCLSSLYILRRVKQFKKQQVGLVARMVAHVPQVVIAGEGEADAEDGDRRGTFAQ